MIESSAGFQPASFRSCGRLEAGATRLLEEFQRGRTDDDVGVKQLRSKIAALEDIAALLAVQKPNGTREIVVLESDPRPETLE